MLREEANIPIGKIAPLSRYVLGAATVAKEGGGKRIRKKVVDGGS